MVHTKKILITCAILIQSLISSAQYCVGIPVSDTLTTVAITDIGSCYPLFTQNIGVASNMFPYATGLNLGFLISTSIPSGNLSTQTGIVNSGDTLPLSSLVLNYQFYFSTPGMVVVHLITWGTPTVGGETYKCGPWLVVFGTSTCTNPGTILSGSTCTVCPGTGITSGDHFPEMNISPNPSSGIFQFAISNWQSAKTEIEIYNVLGEQVYKTKVKNQKQEINLSEQTKGIYFVKIISAEKIATQKIIIE